MKRTFFETLPLSAAGGILHLVTEISSFVLFFSATEAGLQVDASRPFLLAQIFGVASNLICGGAYVVLRGGRSRYELSDCSWGGAIIGMFSGLISQAFVGSILMVWFVVLVSLGVPGANFALGALLFVALLSNLVFWAVLGVILGGLGGVLVGAIARIVHRRPVVGA